MRGELGIMRLLFAPQRSLTKSQKKRQRRGRQKAQKRRCEDEEWRPPSGVSAADVVLVGVGQSSRTCAVAGLALNASLMNHNS